MKMEKHSIKGKIVLIPFPFDDLSTAKLRPAICLTNAISSYNHIILAFITSQIVDHPLESDIIINESAEYFKKTGLKVSSTIRLHRVITLNMSIIRRELGFMPHNIMSGLNQQLINLFELYE